MGIEILISAGLIQKRRTAIKLALLTRVAIVVMVGRAAGLVVNMGTKLIGVLRRIHTSATNPRKFAVKLVRSSSTADIQVEHV